jgi:hypothetical protein
MAIADSTIRVSIIGDAKNLTKALDKADGGVKGFAKKAGLALAGLAVVDKGFDFVQGALDGADRLGDAMTRLDIAVGNVDSKKLSDMAGDFAKLGLSKGDFETLAANFADLGINAGIARPDVANLADDVAATAAAMSLLDNSDPSANVEAIGRAAGGSAKAMKTLGINVSEAEVQARALKDTGKKTADSLTDGEKATARLNIVLDKLKPKLDAATTGTGDLEQHQKQLQARARTLQEELGTKLAPAIDNVTQFILDEIDAIPHAVDGWRMLGEAVVGFADKVASPLGNVADLIRNINIALHQATGNAGGAINVGRLPGPSTRTSDNSVTRGIQRTTARNGGIGSSLGGP